MTTKIGKLVKLDPKRIKRGWRARKDRGDIDGLAKSIEEIGQLHPIVVTEREDGDYDLVAGERRTRACIKNKSEVLARVVEADDEIHAIEMQFEENVSRKDFDRLEIAEGLKRYKSLFETAHPETKLGASLKKGKEKGKTKAQIAESAKRDEAAERFTSRAARSLNISERVIYELLEVAALPAEDKAEANAAKNTKERNRFVNQAVQKVRKAKKADRLRKRAKAAERKRKAAEKRGDSKPVKNAVQLYHADNRKGLKAFAEGSFDLILTDPPYTLDRSPISHMERKGINVDPVAWDKLDVGWVLRIVPLIVEGGQVLAFCRSQDVGLYEWAFEKAGLEYRGDITWWKTNPPPVHRPVYNQAAAGEKIVWAVKPGATPFFREFKNAGTEEAHNVIRGPICMGEERLDHPTQKPEWLVKKLLIRHASRNLGTRVLDPFAGVATTLAVCKRLRLPCVGIEKEKEYVEQGEARLASITVKSKSKSKSKSKPASAAAE